MTEGDVVVADRSDADGLTIYTAVWTNPSCPWIKEVYDTVREVTGEDAGSEPRTAPYFTDASALTPALGNPPTIIRGAKGSRESSSDG
jgi:succinyl-diaminopimelate desuccinylase